MPHSTTPIQTKTEKGQILRLRSCFPALLHAPNFLHLFTVVQKLPHRLVVHTRPTREFTELVFHG